VERYIDISLLNNEDFRSEISSLTSLGGGEVFDRCANEEDVCEIVELRFGDVGLFENVPMNS
jgi:hypothetical protein